MSKSIDDQLLELHASVATIALLLDCVLAWHFQKVRGPLGAAHKFGDALTQRIERGVMPGFDPVVSDVSVQLVTEQIQRHMDRVYRLLEQKHPT